jgi:hypothetical protein
MKIYLKLTIPKIDFPKNDLFSKIFQTQSEQLHSMLFFGETKLFENNT